MHLYIGCSGWSYTSWQGPFYPEILDNKGWLPYYSQVFNYVEIDSTFYNIPSEVIVSQTIVKKADQLRKTIHADS